MGEVKETKIGGTEETNTNHVIRGEVILEKSLVGQGAMTRIIQGGTKAGNTLDLR